ncbi:MAG: LysM peptidoglycan-binding domain-containing protein [Pseudomonadota bacterium]
MRRNSWLLAGLSAGLVACASAPSPKATADISQTVPVTVAPSTELDPLIPLSGAALEGLLEPEPIPGDLLDRVRGGMKLGEVRNTRIDKQADWFASQPEFIERTFSRAAPYMHYIVNEVQARGMPMELALLPVIESAFQPYAYSRARATGLWQFMSVTGGRFGLKQDWWYDGRRDVVAATQAALDYLQYLHDMFDGDWLLAVAAYNCGEGNVSRAVRNNRAAHKSIDFWNLKLPKETRDYVPRLLAMSRIVADPEQFGLAIEGMSDEPYFIRTETGGQISMEVAAELAGISTEDLYALNPAFHRWATDPTGPHFLLLPVESADAFQQSLLLLTPDQRLRVERYTVRKGDTISSVASRFGTTSEHMREMNGLEATATSLETGSEMRVPSAVKALPPQVLQAAARFDKPGKSRRSRDVRAVHVVRRGDSLWSIAKRHNMDVVSLANLNSIDPADTLRAGQRLQLTAGSSGKSSTASVVADSGDGHRVTYVVQRGDTLSGIAHTLRVSVSSLRDWNDLSGKATIKPGQRLVAYVQRGT